MPNEDGQQAAFSVGRFSDMLCWAVSTSIALVSTKYILVNANYHYPLRLLFLHLLVGLVSWFIREVLSIPQITAFLPKWIPRNYSSAHKTSMNATRIILLIASLSLAICLPLFMQAILHFSNLTTLSMLMAFALFFEAVCTQSLLGMFQTRSFLIRALLLAPLAMTVLGDEYRLSANGLLFALPAIGIAGFSKALLHLYYADSAKPVGLIPWDECSKIILPASFIITGFWTALTEGFRHDSTAFPRLNAFILLVNIVSIAISMRCGPFETRISSSADSQSTYDGESRAFAIGVIAAGVSLVGSTGLGSLNFLTTAYSTILQLLAFFVAFIASTDSSYMFDLKSETIAALRTLGNRTSKNGYGALPTTTIPLEDVHESASSPTSPSLAAFDPPAQVKPPSSRVNSAIQLILAIFVVMVWFLFILGNFSWLGLQHHEAQPAATFDLDYQAPVDLDIVVSMFDESTEDVQKLVSQLKALPNLDGLSTRLLIYTKNEKVNVEALKDNTGASEVIHRANMGREGETYLYHIITNWDSLAKQTLFVQAHVHNSSEFFRRIRQFMTPETGMLSLGFSGMTCDCHSCSDRFGWSESASAIQQVYQDVFHEECKELLLSYKGQFIASAKRIRGVDKDVYEKLDQALVDPESWMHQEEYLQGRPDSINAPFFGYTLERMWSVLLQCSDIGIAKNCPTLLSGWRSGGSLEDCQCLDG